MASTCHSPQLIDLPCEILTIILNQTGPWKLFCRATCKYFADIIRTEKVEDILEFFDYESNIKYLASNETQFLRILDLRGYFIAHAIPHNMISVLAKYSIDESRKKILYERVVTADDIDLLKYLNPDPMHAKHLACVSANRGSFECLKYLCETFQTKHLSIMDSAAYGGHLNCIKYLHDNGVAWGSSTCMTASRSDHLDCLKYLHENGCPWDTSTIYEAARYGRRKCLKYARDNGCPYNHNTLSTYAILSGNAACIDYVKNQIRP